MCRVGEPACTLPHAALTRAPALGQRPGHRFHTAENPLLARKKITLSLKFSRKTITWKRNSSVWVIFFLFCFRTWSGEGDKLHNSAGQKPHFRGFGENPGPRLSPPA